jgi:hypothetical protein
LITLVEGLVNNNYILTKEGLQQNNLVSKMNFIAKYWLVIVVVFGVCIFIKPPLCFLLLGVLIVYMSLEAIIFLNKMATKGIACTGIIIEYQSDSDGDKIPLVEFTTIAGDLISGNPYVSASTSLSKVKAAKGSIQDTVSILYDPKDPKKFEVVNDRRNNYAILILFLLLGLLSLLLGTCTLLGYIRID